MMLGRYRQEPGEKIKRIIDLDDWLEEDETITDVTVKSITPVSDSPFTCPSVIIDPEGKKFAYYLTGGESGETYEVEFTITTQTQIAEYEIEIDVEED